MSRLSETIQQLRTDLLRRDTLAAQGMLDAYTLAYNRISDTLELLIESMQQAKAEGVELSQAWLLRQQRYEQLLQQAQGEMERFGAVAQSRVITEQRQVVIQAESDTYQMTLAALEDAGKTSAVIAGNWNRLPQQALTEMIGAFQDGSPLRTLFDGYGVQASKGIRDALITGLATGTNPRKIGTEIRKVIDIGHTRTQTIARTETLRAYRSASVRTYAENSGVVRGWIWVAALSSRTCPACLSLHGKRFPLETAFGSHPNCRCSPAPFVEDGPLFPSGEDWLRDQSSETQDNVLGSKAAQAWRSGEVSLSDFVGEKDDTRFGMTRFVVSLDEAKFKAEMRQ
jgi:SPP1 gp7 family putative phage head morphogenesis protein